MQAKGSALIDDDLPIDPAALERLAEAINVRAPASGGRFLVAIAGPPGVGKSTFTEGLCERLRRDEAGCAEILPMDGFHYDDIVLNEWGERARKGAPHTFDVEGFSATLRRIRDTVGDVAVPVFDRSIEIARAGARIITPEARIVLVEGNYLLLDDPRWTPLRGLFDLTVMLEAPFAVIEDRLRQRWHALQGEELAAKMEGNDLPNVRLVLERSVAADIIVDNGIAVPAGENA